jgi:hypothetical protein
MDVLREIRQFRKWFDSPEGQKIYDAIAFGWVLGVITVLAAIQMRIV